MNLLSSWNFILVFYILMSLHQNSEAWDEYKNFYSQIANVENESSSYLINAIWYGVTQVYNPQFKKCYADIGVFKNAVFHSEKWALKMLDASTHMQPGFLEGNIIDYGNYDECLKIENTVENFKGQICKVSFYPNETNKPNIYNTYQITAAVCIPSSCNTSDVMDLLRFGFRFPITYGVRGCVSADSYNQPLLNFQFYILLFGVALLTIISFATSYDFCLKNCKTSDEDKETSEFLITPNQPVEETSVLEGALLSFSIIKNWNNIFKEDDRHESIKCLHGIRFIAALGTLCVHRHLLETQSFTNTFMFDTEVRKWYRMIVFNAYIWVDVFFLLSGLLISYNFLLRKENKRKSLNIFKMYLHRYIRLTPTLAAVIMIALMSDRLCVGPHCDFLNRLFKERCEQNWWGTLLYLGNIIDQHNMCVIQSWYLSADTQMYFVMAPILLYFLMRWPKFIFVKLMILFSIATAYVYFVSYFKGLRATFIADYGFFKEDAEWIYNQSYGRAAPWLLGFGLGIILHEITENPPKLSKTVLTTGWVIAIVFINFSMFGLTYFVRIDYTPEPIVDSLFKACYRSIFAAGFAWIIFVCVSGYGGWVNRFLSQYIFQVLSKLTYSFYLIHTFAQFLIGKEYYVPRRYSDMTQFSIFIGDVYISLICAVILHLAVEGPAFNLEKVFWNRKKVVHEPEETRRRIVKEA